MAKAFSCLEPAEETLPERITQALLLLQESLGL
jgi:hypothetical protein